MQVLAWWPDTGEGLLVFAGMLIVWTMALYVLTRGHGLVPTLAACAMGTLGVYLLGNWAGALAFPEHPTEWVAWLRGTWWAAALAPAVWLASVLALAADESTGRAQALLRRVFWPAVSVLLVLGLVFGALGVVGEALQGWSLAYPATPALSIGLDPVSWHIPPGPLFAAFQTYVLMVPTAAVALLIWLYFGAAAGAPTRPRFAWLIVSSALFVLGGGWIAVASGAFGLSALPGEAILITGLAVLGWNIARYGALLQDEVVSADFRAFALSTLAVVALYAMLIAFVPSDRRWPLGERVLLFVVLTTHALADRSSTFLDRVLFEPASGSLRVRLRSMAERVVRHRDPMTALVEMREQVDELIRDPMRTTSDGHDAATPPREFRALVEASLRHVNDLPTLSHDRLVGRTHSTFASGGSALERAGLLRADLLTAIERLRPPGPRPTPGGSTGPGGWVHYLVLHEAYIEGRLNKHIMQRYYLSESTFHRLRRRAVDSIALDLYQRAARELVVGEA